MKLYANCQENYYYLVSFIHYYAYHRIREFEKKSSNQGTISEFGWPGRDSGQSKIFFPHMHMERMTVRGEGRPLHAWFIVHNSVFNVTMFVNSVKDCLDLKIS